ncbi:MAG: FAD-dependent oxidoreductase [Myxococcota bacterium]|nr:FAD-dependent oxidoreductase [Myxococcota bacterium]
MSALWVVGAGVAGTAAALAAARAGARVTLVDGGTGASTLATGALDAVPWQSASAQRAPIAPLTRVMLDALGGYTLPEGGARLLTTSGVVRPARGHDTALLDVEPLERKGIGVVACDRPGWDAKALARGWGGNYVIVDAVMMRHVDEHVLPDADFATRHDDDARLRWLAERLREALARVHSGVSALVLPPCLGVERQRARTLSDLVGVRCGEAIALPGGPAGLRFERARDRALAASDVERVRGRLTRVARKEDRWSLAMEGGPSAQCDAVVLATGGLIGGGIEYAPGESVLASAVPPFARPPFRLTVDAPMTLGADGSELRLPSTLFGTPPESITWPFNRDAIMDRVGVLTDEVGRASRGLFVAGDLRADRPRTWLDVLATGIAAGAAAARDVHSDHLD